MGDKPPLEDRAWFVPALAIFSAAMLAWGIFWLWVAIWGWELL